MSDLIERDKAIANMRKNHDVNLGTLPTGNRSYEDIWHCVAIAYDEGIEYAIKVLNGMPSAQPEPQWIPCSERMPEDLEEVNVTWVNHDPEPYYDFTKDKPATASAVYYKGKWYWYSSVCTDLLAEYGENEVDKMDDAIEVLAWMPLPEPWRGEEHD